VRPECNTPGACDFDGGDCETVSCNQKTDRTVLPCKRSFIGDGRCDLVCNVTACDFDKGDCGAQCSPGCRPEMIGNGFCDDACRAIGNDGKPLCTTPAKPTLFDGGDCLSCAPGCVDSWVGDGSCDEACRVADACKNDLLDCTGCPCDSALLGNGKCDGSVQHRGLPIRQGRLPEADSRPRHRDAERARAVADRPDCGRARSASCASLSSLQSCACIGAEAAKSGAL
jgi:hypothetical protein